MTQQWGPPPSGPPRNQSNQGIVYALIALVAVLAVTLAIVAVMVFGGSDSDTDSSNVADAGQMEAPPAPAAESDGDAGPRPTAGATGAGRDADSGDGADSGATAPAPRADSGSRVWGADAGLEYCGNGGVRGSAETSCAFAERVADAVWDENVGKRHLTVRAFSPVTKRVYIMKCELGSMTGHDAAYRCTGGDNAIVYVGIAG